MAAALVDTVRAPMASAAPWGIQLAALSVIHVAIFLPQVVVRHASTMDMLPPRLVGVRIHLACVRVHSQKVDIWFQHS